MKLIVSALLLISFFSGCVVKKDSAASAAVAVELAKTLARSFAGGAGAPAQYVSGVSAAAVPSCTVNTSGSITCTTEGLEIQMTITGSGISGYEKMTNYVFNAGGKTDYINGQINIIGNFSSVFAATGQYSFTTTEKFNGKLKVTGGDTFDIEFKDFGITVVLSGAGTSFSMTSACSGILAVDTIDFALNADCSIAN